MFSTALRVLGAVVFAAVFFLAGFSIGHDRSAIPPLQARPKPSSTPTNPDESVPTGFHASNRQSNAAPTPPSSPVTAHRLQCNGNCKFDIAISARTSQARTTTCDPGYYYCALISNPNGYAGATWDSTAASATAIRNIYLRVEWSTPAPGSPH
jgi:hypothetical protein